MKHIARLFFSLTAALPLFFTASAQKVETPSSFRIGKLDNGLTYYLYHNENPAGCADFYIAHNVGALQEEDNQNGLAHFLEHMAFNGTKHYPGKRIIEFLGDEGVRFGYNINAYTARNETVYNINNVPLVRESFVDSVLMILHDWSCDISCEQQALDDERGVISEEWRLRDIPRYRMMCRQNELIYKGGKQPERTVIGSYDVINGFRREEILDFYDKWYRPDLQAIFVVGDFDVDRMEEKIRGMFADITMPDNPPLKPSSYTPAPQSAPMYADQTDPTIKYKVYKIIYKQPFPDADMRGREEFLKDYYSRLAVSTVLGDRLRDKARSKDCPFSSAVCVTNSYEPDYYISLFTVTPRNDNDLAAAVRPVLREINRMIKYGISKDELEAARLSLMRIGHNDRDLYPEDVRHSDVVKLCIENFLRGYPCVDPIEWQALQRKAIDGITLDDLAGYPARMFCHNQVIYSNCHNVADTTALISREVMENMTAEVSSENLAPSYLEYPSLDLAVNSPEGAIVNAGKADSHGVERWKLSNGVTVFYRHSAPVNSSLHLSMEAVFDTGYSVYDSDRICECVLASAYLKRYAFFGGVDRTMMKNYPELFGVNDVTVAKPEYSGFSFSAKPDYVETAFKSLNLHITDPCFGSDKLLSKFKSDYLKNLGKPKNSRDLYNEKVEDLYYGNNPWHCRPDSAAVESLDMEKIKNQYAREFGDVSTLKLYICSDLDKSVIEDYVCKYVASIPSTEAFAKTKNNLWQGYEGNVTYSENNAPLSAPMCDIDCRFSCSVRKDTRLRVAVSLLDYILSMRYLYLIREERGGAYHVAFSTTIGDDPGQKMESSVNFQTRPELKDLLLKDVSDLIAEFAKQGPTEDEMNMAKRFFAKRYGELRTRKSNNIVTLMSEVKLYERYGIDFDYDCDAVLSDIDAKYLRKLAGKIASGDRFTSVLVEK